VSLRRLLPDFAETTPLEQYTGLRLGEKAPAERPYVVTNFVTSLDGRATLRGRAGPLGSALDKEVLHVLRTQADAVMIGAGTMRAECYGRLVPDPELRGLRERAEGLAHDPLAVIVTRSLDLPWECGLFSSGWGRVLIATSSDEDIPELPTATRVWRFADPVDPEELLRRLRSERGIRALLCEGGPHTHAQLFERHLLDEIFVTVAPKLAGGSGPNLIEGALEEEHGLEQVWLCEGEGGELFTRYRVTPGPAG
jgi:riboflavin-specific deaminase-like protein